MSVRTQRSCIAIRTPSSSSSSHPRCFHESSAPDDHATCGTPTWIGKGLTCVCFKRKGAYERICINLTPSQAQREGLVKIHFDRVIYWTWDEPYLYKYCHNQLIIRCVPEAERLSILSFCHDQACGGHFSSKKTAEKEERMQRLKHRMKVYFDASRPDHQGALRALWYATFPGQELQGLISEQWKEMGWQGRDPSTDFRGAGFISLENLLFFAKTFSTSFQQLLTKQGGKRATWEYPFAVAGVNVTFMIMQMLDLDASKPRTFVRTVFIQMLSENEWAFDLLYCVAFVVMDKQWLEKNATYMEFNDIMKCTRAQLERELLLDDVLRIEDMPSYGLLC